MKTRKKIIVPVLASILVFLASCGTKNTTTTSSTSTTTSTSTTVETINSWTTSTNILKTVEGSEIVLNWESVNITKAGTYNISGTLTNGILLVDVGKKETVILNLNGVNITNQTGSAIYIKSWKATINLSWENTLIDGKTYSDTSDSAPNATLYAEEDLKITWTWTLNVTANYADAIASKDDLIIENWNFVIKSTDDAIRWKDSLQILDWNFNITSTWDALKSSHESDSTKWYVHIKWWKFEISAGSDAIQWITKVTIDWWEINIKSSVEWIEATQIYINSWKITLNATDDWLNVSKKWLSDGTDLLISISGWNLDITMAAWDTDAIDSNWDLIISGWNINIKAQSAFDFDGKATFTWWNVIVNWEKVTTITNSMMWWPRGGMWWEMRPW